MAFRYKDDSHMYVEMFYFVQGALRAQKLKWTGRAEKQQKKDKLAPKCQRYTNRLNLLAEHVEDTF